MAINHLAKLQRQARVDIAKAKLEVVAGANGHAVQMAQAEINKMWIGPAGNHRQRWPQDFPPGAPKPPGPYRDLVKDG
jgi:hypothetical protein